MRVLLVYAAPDRRYWPVGVFRSNWVPTGLAYMGAALLKAGHDVRVHVREEVLVKNSWHWQASDELLRRELMEFRPGMVGVSALSPMVADTARTSLWAKEICGPDVLTVAGGAHPSAIPEQTLQDCEALDAVAIGEGEHTIVELAEKGVSRDVAGLAYRENGGEFVRTAKRKPCADLDSLGPLPYELFDMEFYCRANPWLIRWISIPSTNIRTSRGCTNRCRFCAGHVVAGLGVRYHSIDYVMEQVANAVNRFGVEGIHFEDDTVGADRERLVELCRRIRAAGMDRKMKWDCCLRVSQLDRELLAEMKASGCIQIEYGFECGSDAGLGRIGKNTTMADNRRAVTLTRQAGIRVFADIMLGLPGETAEDIQATVDFIRWSRPEVLSAGRLYPLPGTAIYSELPDSVRSNIDWGTYSYIDLPGPRINLTSMPDEEFETVFRRFQKYIASPQMSWAFLRDNPHWPASWRRGIWKKLARFVLQHPIRAFRVPW